MINFVTINDELFQIFLLKPATVKYCIYKLEQKGVLALTISIITFN
jgi:hypothetical protein